VVRFLLDCWQQSNQEDCYHDHPREAYQKEAEFARAGCVPSERLSGLQNNGVSRQHFYDIKKAYEEQGIEGLREKTRRKPCLKNRVVPEIEAAVIQMAYEYLAYGQARASNELRKQGILVSSGGVRSIWLRHGLERFRKRMALLEKKAAKEGIVYTEAQLVALEAVKRERQTNPDEIETAHPGYLLSQDTFYVGYLKGVGRIYQQTAVDTYSSLSLAKVYTAKVPVTAADLLNDRVSTDMQK